MNHPIYGIICLCAVLTFILAAIHIDIAYKSMQPMQQQQGCVTYDDDSELDLHFGGKGRERIEDDKIYKNYFKY